MNDKITAYIIDTNTIREVEVIKITNDFVTVRYKTHLPDSYGMSFEVNGGMRLRKSRVFKTKEEAQNFLNNKRRG